MNRSKRSKLLVILVSTVGCTVFPGCGGTKILKEPQPLEATQALAIATDSDLTATLDWVIVRDGPGTWAKNADWDQYMLTVNNESAEPLRIIGIHIVDSLDTQIEPELDRKQLVKASKKTVKRYKGANIRVKAGAGARTLMVTGTAVAVVGVGAIYGAAYTALASGSTSAAGAAGAASGLVILGPALLVRGVVRGVNNRAVHEQILALQTVLPVEVQAGQQVSMTIFFPIAPSPRQFVLTYRDQIGEHQLVIETAAALSGLHIDAPDRIGAIDRGETRQ